MKTPICILLAYLGVICLLSNANNNIALHKTAFQSSTAHEGNAGRAVDGNRNSNYSHSSCTHTWDYDTMPWWAADLEESHDIISVVIVNRLIVPWRLHDFNVGVTDIMPISPMYPSMYTLCHTHPGAATEGQIIEFYCNQVDICFLIVITGLKHL